MKQIMTPLLYLRIRHVQKSRFDFWAPFVLASVFFIAIYFSDYWLLIYDPIKKQSLLSDRILTLLAALSGFFVAALAAIATFNGQNLDEIMQGDPVTLRHGRYRNEPENLTRRRFLSFLFGYLAFLSFIFTIMVVFAPVVGELFFRLREFSSDFIYQALIFNILGGFIVFIYLFLFFHIFVITLLGLHYLTERISRE